MYRHNFIFRPTVIMDTTNLSSPRQQAVADAVKFGFTEADEAIPYIDDATTPQEPDVCAVAKCRY